MTDVTEFIQYVLSCYQDSVEQKRPCLKINEYQSADSDTIAHFILLMNTILKNLADNITLNVRSFYYQYKSSFKSQYQSDGVIKAFVRHSGFSRSQLNLTTTAKGLVFGPFKLTLENGSVLEGETVITNDLESSSQLETTAKRCLIVEKDTVFQYLKQNYDVIAAKVGDFLLVTGKGQPDQATKMFCAYLSRNMPCFALVDCNSYGQQIAFSYRFDKVHFMSNLVVIGLFEGKSTLKQDEKRLRVLIQKLQDNGEQRWAERTSTMIGGMQDELDTLIKDGSLIDFIVQQLQKY